MEVRSRDTRMIVVDSNTWAGYFNGAPNPHVRRLDTALRDEEDLAILPMVSLQSIRELVDRHARELAAATEEAIEASEKAKSGTIGGDELLVVLRAHKSVVKRYMAALEDYVNFVDQP